MPSTMVDMQDMGGDLEPDQGDGGDAGVDASMDMPPALDMPDLADQVALPSCGDSDLIPGEFDVGDGMSPETAYLICSVEELDIVRNQEPGKFYRIGRDLDLSGWGSPINCFDGHLDGGGHVLSNLTLTTFKSADDNRGCSGDDGNESDARGLLFNEVKGTLKSLRFSRIKAGEVNDPVLIGLFGSQEVVWLGGVVGRTLDGTVIEGVSIDGASAWVNRQYAHLVGEAIGTEFIDIAVTEFSIEVVQSGYVAGVLAHGQDVILDGVHVQGEINSPKRIDNLFRRTGLVVGWVDSDDMREQEIFALDRFFVDGSIVGSDREEASQGPPKAYDSLGLVVGGMDLRDFSSDMIQISNGLVRGSIETTKIGELAMDNEAAGIIGSIIGSAGSPTTSLQDMALHKVTIKGKEQANFLLNSQQSGNKVDVERIHVIGSNITSDSGDVQNQESARPLSNFINDQSNVCIQNTEWTCNGMEVCTADNACATTPSGFMEMWIDRNGVVLPAALWSYLDAIGVEPEL